MSNITITVVQSSVYDEVAKATDYTGSKMLDEDEKARDRIFTTDEDLETLSRFWEEAAADCTDRFKPMIVSATTTGGNYVLTLEVSMSFDTNLTGSVETAIKSFFISSIIGQWFKFANKKEATEYSVTALDHLLTAERLLYSRKKPSLPTT